MIPATFPEATTELARPPDMTEEECGPLSVYHHEELKATVSCWTMSWRERLSALVFGRVWVWVHAGGVTQPPIALLTCRTIFNGKGEKS